MMNSETTLSAPLVLNAVLSLGAGLLLAIAGPTVGGWLGVDIDGWLRLFGVVLIAHAPLLLWASRQPNVTMWARLNLATIAPYPLLMLALVVGGLVSTGAGVALVLIDGAAIGGVAIWLARALGIGRGSIGTPESMHAESA